MKKIVLALVVLMFAAPAWADVNITCTDLGEGKVLVSFDATTEPNLVRAFGLDFQCDNDATIGDVNSNPANLPEMTGYWVYPGTIQIDAGGNVTSYGSGVSPSSYPDTMNGPPDSNMTIQMGSLYYPPDGPGSPNAPVPNGSLVSFTVDKDTCITISGNVARAGNTGVVMESPDETPTVNFPLVTECCVTLACSCVGDVDGNGAINKPDIIALVNYLAANASAPFWTVASSNPAYDDCADVDGNGAVNKPDIIALVNYLAANASAPFWTVPCP